MATALSGSYCRRSGEQAGALQPDRHPRHGDADGDAEQPAPGRGRRGAGRRSPAATASKHHHERQRQAVVDAGLDVEQVPQPGRAPCRCRPARRRTPGRSAPGSRRSASASGQSSPATKWASSAVTSSVSGSPQPSARPGSRHALRRSAQPTRMPSVNSTANSASSARLATTGESGSSGTTPVTPSPRTNPATRNSTAVDSTVRWASADTSTASSSMTANANRNPLTAPVPFQAPPIAPAATEPSPLGLPTVLDREPDHQQAPCGDHGRRRGFVSGGRLPGSDGAGRRMVGGALPRRLRRGLATVWAAHEHRRPRRRPGCGSPLQRAYTPATTPTRAARKISPPQAWPCHAGLPRRRDQHVGDLRLGKQHHPADRPARHQADQSQRHRRIMRSARETTLQLSDTMEFWAPTGAGGGHPRALRRSGSVSGIQRAVPGPAPVVSR